MFKLYRKSALQEMRPYDPGEDLTGISVSDQDTPEEGGMIARNSANHADQWYVGKEFFEDNYEPAEPPKGETHERARSPGADPFPDPDRGAEVPTGPGAAAAARSARPHLIAHPPAAKRQPEWVGEPQWFNGVQVSGTPEPLDPPQPNLRWP